MKWLTWVLATAGSALVTFGVFVAVLIGPQEWVESPPRLVNSQDGVVFTNYGLLSYSLPVRIAATADGAPAFVGLAHSIDAEDYLSGVKATGISGFSPLGLTSYHRSGTTKLPTAPQRLDFWKMKASGAGRQIIEGTFAGQPVVAFISTADGTSKPLSVSIGVRLVGAFAISIAAATVGALLLLASGWHWHRRRTQPTRPDSPPRLPNDLAQSSAKASPQRVLKRSSGLILGGVVLFSAAGCSAASAVPHSVPLPPRSQLTRDSLEGVNLAALSVDYDKRNNAAIKASRFPKYSAAEWAGADAGLLLGADRFSTTWDRITKVKRKPYSCTTAIKSSYRSAPAKAYPISIVVARTFSCGKTKDTTYEYAVFTRSHSYSPWLSAATASAGKNLPSLGRAAPTTDQTRAGAAATKQLLSYLKDGRRGNLGVSASLHKWRAKQHKSEHWYTARWAARAVPHGTTTFSTRTGALTLVSVRITETFVAKKGEEILWRSPYDKIYQQTGSRHMIRREYGLNATIGFSKGKPVMLDWNATDLLG